jgi:sn-glycerol 3-phosphate transport system substrate-binding protein
MRRLILALATLFAFAASAAAERKKFDLWHGLSGDLAGVVEQVCQRFNVAQPDYEIVCTSQGTYDAALQNAIAAYRAKKAPAIVQVFDVGTLDLLLSDAFVPARQLMAENGYTIDWGDYFPGIADYYADSKGALNSFPFNSSTAMLYWNRDAFAKIGLSEAPQTIEELTAAMAALKGAGYDCPFAWDYYVWIAIEQFSAIHNLPVATRGNGHEGLDAELVINKTKLVDFIKLLKGAYDRGELKIKTAATGQGVVQAFASGACQMMFSSIGDHGTVGKTASPDMRWDVAPLPVYAGTERRNSLVGGASLWVLKGHGAGEYKGAAAFFNFLAKPESALFWSTNTGYIPVTKSGFEFMKAQGFYDKPPFKGRERAIASLTASPVGPLSRGIRLGGFVQIRKELTDAMVDIIAGKTPVEEALNAAAERSNVVLRRFEKTYAGKAMP